MMQPAAIARGGRRRTLMQEREGVGIRVFRRVEPFTYARHVEFQSAEHYAGLAADAPDRVASWMFTFLEGRERCHCALFDALLQHRPLPQCGAGVTAISVDDVIGRIAVLYRTLGSVPCDPRGTCERAREFEKSSVAFFEELMSRLRDTRRRGLVQSVLREEERHTELVGRLARLYRRPYEWLYGDSRLQAAE